MNIDLSKERTIMKITDSLRKCNKYFLIGVHARVLLHLQDKKKRK